MPRERIYVTRMEVRALLFVLTRKPPVMQQLEHQRSWWPPQGAVDQDLDWEPVQRLHWEE